MSQRSGLLGLHDIVKIAPNLPFLECPMSAQMGRPCWHMLGTQGRCGSSADVVHAWTVWAIHSDRKEVDKPWLERVCLLAGQQIGKNMERKTV